MGKWLGIAAVLAMLAAAAARRTKWGGIMIREIGAEGLRAMLDTGRVLVLDVREPHEFAGGHLPGALPLPLGSLPHRLQELPRDRPIVTVCRSGHRSGKAAGILAAAGFGPVYSLKGGMDAWPSAGRSRT